MVGFLQPILLFEREERANDNQKQNTVTFQRGAGELKSRGRGRINRGAARREDLVYAGFELELAGAEALAGEGTEVKASVILRSAFYAVSRRSPVFLSSSRCPLSWPLESLFIRDLIRRGQREGRKVEAIREKIQVKLEKKNHAR